MFGFVNKIVRSPKGRVEGKGPVTILLNNGQVLEFPTRVKCSGVLASHPNHTVCHASALVLHQQMKMLAPEVYMEPGEIYFLVPKPAGNGKKASGSLSESSSLLQEEGEARGASPVKFVISKQYLAKILAEGNADRPTLTRSETNPWNAAPRQANNMAVRRARSTYWSGPLDSIAEVPS